MENTDNIYYLYFCLKACPFLATLFGVIKSFLPLTSIEHQRCKSTILLEHRKLLTDIPTTTSPRPPLLPIANWMSQILGTANKTYLALVFHRGEAPEDDLYAEYSVLVSQHATAAVKELQGYFCHLPEVSPIPENTSWLRQRSLQVRFSLTSCRQLMRHTTAITAFCFLFVFYWFVHFVGMGRGEREHSRLAFACTYVDIFWW